VSVSWLLRTRVVERISRGTFLWLSLLLLATSVYLRRHLAVNYTGLALLALVSVYFQLVPRALHAIAQRSQRFTWLTPAMSAAVCFFAFLALGVVLGWAGGILLATGSAAVLWRARGGTDETPTPTGREAAFIVAVVAVVLAAWWCVIVSTSWGSHYLTPTFEEQIWSGTTNRDSTISIVYSMMFRQYGVLSHGIHGLPPFHYHLGANVFLTALAAITRQSSSFAYNFGFVAVVIPAVLGTLHWIVVSSLPTARASTQAFGLLVITALVVQIVPQSILEGYGLWASYFLSESYLFGLWLGAMYVASLIAVLRTPRTLAGAAVTNLAMGAFLGWTVFSKVSVGLVCAAVFGLLFLGELRRSWRAAPWGLAVCSVLGALVGAWRAYFPDPVSYEWDYFITRYGQGNVVRFYLLHYYHLWLAIAVVVLVARLRPAATSDRAPTAMDYLRWTLVAFMLGLPSLHMTIAGGSGYYFTNIVMWIAIPVSALGAIQLIDARPFRWLVVASAVVTLLVVPSVRWHARRIPATIHQAKVDGRTAKKQQTTPLGKYIAACHRIAATTSEDTMVYVAKTEQQYFGAFDVSTYRECEVAPFIMTKECARPLLYGVPANDPICSDSVMVKRWLGTEYAHFPEAPTHDDLCHEVRRYSMTKYVAMHWNEATADVDLVENSCK